MAGYIGSKASVTQVDGYNTTEADAEFLNQTEGDARYVELAGDTLTGALTGTDLTLSGGVYLGGTGSANKLDDYEEGTWTPVLTAQNGTVAVQSAFDTLYYTKVGRTVTVTGRFRIGSTTGNSGYLRITLPFASAANVEGAGFAALSLLTHGTDLPNTTVTTFAEVNPASTEAYFYAQQDNVAWTLVDASGFSNGDIVYVNGTYTTA